jgi:cytochrome c-type biogenesis protein CcmF
MTTWDFGVYSITFALLLAAGAILASLASVRQESPGLLRAARWAIHGAAAVLTGTAVALMAAILGDDFRLAYVAGYSERAMPVQYKLSAFWAGQEGSLLLWSWLLAVMASIAVSVRRKEPPQDQAPVIGILGAVCGFFAAVLLFAANPFQLSGVVLPDGEGMKPLLQSPAMIWHPPVLFAGYAGFTIPFAFALGALITGRSDSLPIAQTRRWVLASWLFLSAGILLGAQWAYTELGWGGYWAWDPVENASLLPWFTATALLHSLIAQQRRGTMKVWNAALIALTFVLCILGTYLTRSGVISSVHAFPESPIGWFFLGLLLVSLAGSAALILARLGRLRGEHRLEGLLNRQAAFVAGNVLMVVMMLATLVGTMYPLLSQLFADQPIALGGSYYNTVVLPLGMAAVAMMGLGPLLPAGRGDGNLGRRLAVPAVGGVAAGAAVGLAGATEPWALVAAVVCAFVAIGVGQDFVRTMRLGLANPQRSALGSTLRVLRTNVRRYGGMMAHLGVAMLVIGVAGSSLYSLKKDIAFTFNEASGAYNEASLGRYTLHLDSLEQVRGRNYTAVEAKVTLTGADGERIVLTPQKRFYDKFPSEPYGRIAVEPSLREDVYLNLAGWRSRGKVATIQGYVNPLVNWIWIGGCVLGLAGLLCLLPRIRTQAAATSAQPDVTPAQATDTPRAKRPRPRTALPAAPRKVEVH